MRIIELKGYEVLIGRKYKKIYIHANDYYIQQGEGSEWWVIFYKKSMFTPDSEERARYKLTDVRGIKTVFTRSRK